MGMFDWVDYTCPCPKCGNKVEGFQTKDTDCTLSVVEPTDCRNFYAECSNCGIWINIQSKVNVTGFEVTCEKDIRNVPIIDLD